MSLLSLGLQNGKEFQIDANMIATGRTCILGTSGSGKSYAVGVICEELCKNHVPFSLIDTEGEYSGLKEKYEVVLVSDDEPCDLKWDELNYQELGKQAPDIAPLILDISGTDDPKSKIGKLLTIFYEEISKRRTPYLIILEEADRFAPQVGDRLQILNEIARRGRKRGLGLMICTQRPSLVDKNILSQCSNQLIGKLIIKNDLEAVVQFFPGRGLPKQLTTLSPGVFYALGNLSPVPALVKIRMRETKHGGITPKLMDRVLKPSSEILERLRSFNIERNQIGFLPIIREDDVPNLVNRERSLIFFGEKELITKVELVFRPLVEIVIAVRTGILKKRYEDKSFVLDGLTGKYTELEDGLIFKEGLEKFIGLDTQDIKLLSALSPDENASLIDIASKLNTSKDTVRKITRLLEQKRLVKSTKIGRHLLFSRLIDIPKVKINERQLNLEKIGIHHGKIEESKISEVAVREIVRGLFPESDIRQFNLFYYPLYLIELVLKGKRRLAWLDGRSGKEIKL